MSKSTWGLLMFLRSNRLKKSQTLNLITYQNVSENLRVFTIYEMANFSLVHRIFKKILLIISTVCLGSSSILDRLTHAMIWSQDEKAGLEICSGFNFQWFKRFLRIKLSMIMYLSLEEAWATPSMQAGLLANIRKYSPTP